MRSAAIIVGIWAALVLAGWLLASLVVVAAAPLPLLALPYFLRHRSAAAFDLFEPIWAVAALFGFTYLLVPALMPMRPGAFTSLPGYLDAPSVQWEIATWIAAMAFLSLLTGYYGRVGPWLSAIIPSPGSSHADRVVGPMALIFTVAGVGGMLTAIRLSSADFHVADLLSGELRGATVRQFTGHGYLSVLFDMLALAPSLTMLWARRRGGAARWAVVAGCTAVMLIILFGFLGSRNFALGSIVALTVVFHYRVERLRVAIVLPLVLVLVAVAVAQAERRGSTSVSDPLDSVATLATTLDGFPFLVNTLARTDEVLWGRSVAEDLTLTFVPRALWSDKPSVFGYVRAQEAVVPGLYEDLGRGATFPVGIVAEGYVNFGLLGALVFPALAAIMLRLTYERLRSYNDDYTLVIMAWLIGNAVSIVRGFGFTLPLVLIGAVILLPLLVDQRRAASQSPRGGAHNRAETATTVNKGRR